MLGELHINNFAIIRDISIDFTPGLNIISGDEGSGKSLLVDALGLLMGARAPGGLIRSGETSAHIEAILWPPEHAQLHVNDVLAEYGIDHETNGMLLISRDFQDCGRSIARVNNRAVPLSMLKQLSKFIMDIHGQMEYLSLLDAFSQLKLIDLYGDCVNLRSKLQDLLEQYKLKEKEIEHIRGIDKENHIELLQYQIEDIERAGLDGIDEEKLISERDLLRRAEAITGCCLEAYNLLFGDERSASVIIHKSLMSLRPLSTVDCKLEGYKEHITEMQLAIEEMAREIKTYAETIENSSERLDEIEQLLEKYSSLKRKYGNTLESVVAFRDKAKQELLEITNALQIKDNLEEEKKIIKAEAGKIAEELSLKRRRSAENLVKLVNEELSDIGLEWAKFDIALTRKEEDGGLEITGGKTYACSFSGIDNIEFQVATNPGEPMRSLSAIASGGETSRIILAIKSALKKADTIPTLVFDEIDMGIGGRSADSVGKKLAALSQYHQVLCITHLPQIACFGDSHIKLIKGIESGRAETRMEIIQGANRIKELAAMLGSERNGTVMVKGAEALMRNADKWKNGVREMPVPVLN